MIPAIGIMIGCYIIVRMSELLVLHPTRGLFGLVKVFAVLTILVSVFGIGDLALGSVGTPVASLPTTAPEIVTPRPTRASELHGLSYSKVTTYIGQPESQKPGLLRYATVTGDTFEVYIRNDRVSGTDPVQFDLRQLRSMQP